MNITPSCPVRFEPTTWLLVFSKKSAKPLHRWFYLGQYKHVFAVGYIEALDVWIGYEIGIFTTEVFVMTKYVGCETIEKYARFSTIIAYTPKKQKKFPFWGKFCFWCSPAISCLVGLGCAVTPDQLFRYSLKNGGTVYSRNTDHGCLTSFK